jgi:hypothetical protein
MPTSVPNNNPPPVSASQKDLQDSAEKPLAYLAGVLCSFLMDRFSKQKPQTYRWDADDKQTEVVITSQAPLTSEVRGKKPAIVVMFGPVAQVRLGMDDMAYKDNLTGLQVKRLLYSGSYSLQCLSKELFEAQQLAWMCQNMIWSERSILQKTGGFFQIGQQIGLGAPSPPNSMIAQDGGESLVAVPVHVPFHFPWQVLLTPLNRPVLRDMGILLKTREPAPAQRPPANIGPHLGPGVRLSGPGVLPYRTPPEGNPALRGSFVRPEYPRSSRPGEILIPEQIVGASTPPSVLVRVRVR